MNQAVPKLSVVPDTIEEPRPKFFYKIGEKSQLSEIFVYSQRDYSCGMHVHATSRKFEESENLLPFYGDHTLISLGGSYSKTQVSLALKAMRENEDPVITQLRETIVDAIEAKELFQTAVRTHDDAHEHGIVFFDKYISKEGIALGVLAFEN